MSRNCLKLLEIILHDIRPSLLFTKDSRALKITQLLYECMNECSLFYRNKVRLEYVFVTLLHFIFFSTLNI